MGISKDGTKLLDVQYSDNSPLFFTFSILLAVYTRRKLSIVMQFTLLSWVQNTNSFHNLLSAAAGFWLHGVFSVKIHDSCVVITQYSSIYIQCSFMDTLWKQFYT